MSDEIMVEVWLPLKSYKLKVKHRVLAELGELSHFIINAMSNHKLSIIEIYNVTGLTENQLKPIIVRLQGLNLIDKDLNLTEQGDKLASILTNLHDKEFDIHMDQNYASHRNVWFMTSNNSDCLQEIPPTAIKVKYPGKVRYDFIEDCFLQTQRFQKNSSQYLCDLIPDFKSLYESTTDRWGLEWDISFRSNRSEKNYGLEIDIPLKRHTNNAKPIDDKRFNSLRLYTPVLKLTTSFTLPSGFRWKNKSCIDPITCFYSEHDEEIYENIHFSETHDNGEALVSEESSDNENIACSLLEYINNSPLINPLYSTKHKFSKGWQLHEYFYEEIVEKIQYLDVVKGH